MYLCSNCKTMKHLRHILYFGLLALLFSCNDDKQEIVVETQNIKKQHDSVLQVLNHNWRFTIPAPTPQVSGYIDSWQEWKLYLKELNGKPAAGLQGYRTKAKDMVTRAEGLQNNIPPLFNRPEVRTRISVLLTKVRLVYTFLGADLNIPADRLTLLINDINLETAQLLLQFDELVRRSQIKKEQGEDEMIRALDTLRMANPEMINPDQQPSHTIGGKPNP